ncbi:MAG TPA: Crp/Fnr family transcriptional regulator [Anaerolineae bacterium]|jgi:CRP/FNR family cyclic AMP-dependent transcriptional regulator|nr:Crp/Fnr family transcriptional regulator [Anaerolineae bacterium]
MKESRRSVPEVIAFLRSVPLFADLDQATLNRLTRVCRSASLPKGYMLFNYSDPAESAYVVYSGRIDIMLTTADGRELVINEMGPGDCFGELSLVTNLPRSTNAVARRASDVLIIPRDEFLSELEANPKMLRCLLETTAHRLQTSGEREGALAFLDAAARLARVLLQLDLEFSADGFVTISQDDLAQRLGLARQTVAKTLGQWRRSGWLVTGRGKIVVLNRPALRRIAEEADY